MFQAKPFIRNPKTGPNDPYYIEIAPVSCTMIEKYHSGRCVDYRALTTTGEWISLYHKTGQRIWSNLPESMKRKTE